MFWDQRSGLSALAVPLFCSRRASELGSRGESESVRGEIGIRETAAAAAAAAARHSLH